MIDDVYLSQSKVVSGLLAFFELDVERNNVMSLVSVFY